MVHLVIHIDLLLLKMTGPNKPSENPSLEEQFYVLQQQLDEQTSASQQQDAELQEGFSALQQQLSAMQEQISALEQQNVERAMEISASQQQSIGHTLQLSTIQQQINCRRK